jgi:hypothetical protein
MRGSPLLRALIAFAVLAALGWPLWRLTHRTATAFSSSEAPSVAVQPVQLALAFTSPPRAVEVRHLGRKLWSITNPGTAARCVLELAWPQEGVDLQFEIDWPADGALAAAQVKLTDPTGDEHVQSIWSQGPAIEVLTFH